MSKNNNILNYLIIGAGPIGLYAGNKLKSRNKSFLIVEKRKAIGGQPIIIYPSKEIDNIPHIKKITSTDLIALWSKKIKDSILRNIEISSIKKTDAYFEVILKNMPRVYAKKIIMCSGLGVFNPITLDINGVNDKVLYNVDDLSIFKKKEVIVLGGGDSAVDYAMQISKIAKRVVLSHRRNEMRVSAQKLNMLKKSNVIVLLNKLPVEITRKTELILQDNEVKSIETTPFDYILVQYGHKIAFNKYKYLRGLKQENNKIIVNKNQMTSIKNVYACGDCCTYKGKKITIGAGMKEIDKALS